MMDDAADCALRRRIHSPPFGGTSTSLGGGPLYADGSSAERFSATAGAALMGGALMGASIATGIAGSIASGLSTRLKGLAVSNAAAGAKPPPAPVLKSTPSTTSAVVAATRSPSIIAASACSSAVSIASIEPQSPGGGGGASDAHAGAEGSSASGEDEGGVLSVYDVLLSLLLHLVQVSHPLASFLPYPTPTPRHLQQYPATSHFHGLP